jgi:FMN phosphatase YigB (HAD superfamily)
LQTRFRLGLLSNYPDGPAIRSSLQRIGIESFFSSIVVSGEIGYVKPHRRPFEEILRQMGATPGESIFVGDNWLGDIQGAKRLGLRAIHTRQFVPYEIFDRQAGDHDADGVVEHLLDLEKLLVDKQQLPDNGSAAR